MEDRTIADVLGLSQEELQQWQDEEIQAIQENDATSTREAVSYGDSIKLEFLEETVPLARNQYLITPKGKIIGGFYFSPDANRNEYIGLRAVEAIESRFDLYAPYEGSTFYHVLRRNELNFYPPDMRRVMDLFSEYYEGPRLKIVRAFERPQRGANVHSIGIAVDIEASTKDEAKRIADVAYRTGIPNIVYGGNFSTGNGYVHLDIGPRHKWTYEAGYYSGPGGE